MRALKTFLKGYAYLENLRIEARLRAALACVLVLMFAGAAVPFWHLQRVRNRVTRVSVAGQRLTAVLQINNGLLTLMSRLHRAADSQEPDSFEAEARKLINTFQSGMAGSSARLRDIEPASGREKLVIDSLNDIVEELPGRIHELINLARAGDWIALHGRLADQVDHTDDVAEALMRDADVNFSQEQEQLFEDIGRAERQAGWALGITGILSLLAAALLGLAVTRSITGPLATLHAGTQAIARGDFEHRIEVKGRNELASLAAVFNATAQQLAHLYGQLHHSEERLQELLAREIEARHRAELLNQIGRLLSAELDETRLTQSLIDIATRLVRAETGALLYNMDSAGGPSVVALSGAHPEAVGHLVSLRGTALWPTCGEAIRSGDMAGDEAFAASCAPGDDLPKAALIKSYLATPILSRSKHTSGVLLFGHSDANMFSDRDAEVVMGICAQAAIAMENARLFEQVNIANRALENSNEALRRANDDLSVFAYSASHDLQEPLRNLSLYSQMLQRTYHGRLDPQADEFIGYVVAGAARMSDLVRDLLCYLKVSSAHAHSAPLEPVGPAIDKALSNLQAAIHSSRATVVYNDLPRVAVDEVHLQQLFQNLISNAIKYRADENPQIQISAEKANGYWCFSVKDNGIGINPQYSSTVFRLFKRLHGHSEYPGTGVGLAICQKIVERHGGRIWVESQPGKGSDFRFTLPVGNQ